MILQEYNKAIILVIHYIVKNNAYGVAKALKDEKYDTKNYIPAAELEMALLQLYIADKNRFFKVMKNITWNKGHVSTNQFAKDKLMQLTSIQSGASVTDDNWWQSLISSLSTFTPICTK